MTTIEDIETVVGWDTQFAARNGSPESKDNHKDCSGETLVPGGSNSTEGQK